MTGTTGLHNAGANAAMQHQKIHQAKGADATSQLASGKAANRASQKPSDQAVAAQMESLNKVIDQANINAKNLASVIQLGTKTLLNMRDTLSTMDALATQANAGEIDDSQRAQIHAVMSKLREGLQTAAATTEFNGTKLFTGGAGTATLPAGGAVVAEASTSAAVTDAWAAGIAASSKGYFSGSASNLVVTQEGTAYGASFKVGDQTFEAHNITPANNGVVSFISTTNPNNVIDKAFAAAVTGITDLATMTSTLTTSLGLDPAGTPATFTGASGDPAAEFVTAVTASTTAEAGQYSITAGTGAASATWTLSKSDGTTEEVSVTAGGAQNITFGKAGITFTTAAGYGIGVPVDQIQFDVAQGSAVTMVSQTGTTSADTTTISFSGAQMSQLGTASLKLSAISLATAPDAALASDAIKAALDQISTMYGNLGAAMGNLELKQVVLSDTSNELANAISGVADADIPEAITKQKIAEVMAELANIAQGKALQQSSQLLKLAQQA